MSHKITWILNSPKISLGNWKHPTASNSSSPSKSAIITSDCILRRERSKMESSGSITEFTTHSVEDSLKFIHSVQGSNGPPSRDITVKFFHIPTLTILNVHIPGDTPVKYTVAPVPSDSSSTSLAVEATVLESSHKLGKTLKTHVLAACANHNLLPQMNDPIAPDSNISLDNLLETQELDIYLCIRDEKLDAMRPDEHRPRINHYQKARLLTLSNNVKRLGWDIENTKFISSKDVSMTAVEFSTTRSLFNSVTFAGHRFWAKLLPPWETCYEGFLNELEAFAKIRAAKFDEDVRTSACMFEGA
jgi:hypothetical protein